MKPTTFIVKDPKTGKEKRCVALIRKLTEQECGLLMGCDKETTQTIADSGVSRSAQYKLYGNSIVVDVLYEIFRKAFIQPGNEPDETGQMALF